VRPLYDDGASEAKAVTRDYVLELDTNGPALLSIFGGKITTARHLAEEALGKLARPMGFRARALTGNRPFPGGDFGDFAPFLANVRGRWPFLGEARSYRMARAYGSMLHDMLADIGDETGMGTNLGAGLTEIEARWMHDREWARTPDDALLRRSKIGLHLTPSERTAFDAWWARHFPQ
jgi:glycerol-3-phosphate dehydrogenase